jgi:2-polyprenyl-6-methoxyphenol hydroxylase-like FAD-dependent oxidoreductase
MTDRVDVAVVGAGPAGAATAALLAERGCRVSLLHAGPPGEPPLGESLSAAAKPLLTHLGVWERFCEGPHRPVHERASAWGGELVEYSAIFDPHGPAWLIDRDAFHELLRERSREAGARVLDARVTGCRALERDLGWRLDLAGGAVLDADVVVDATGRSCWLTKTVGGRCQTYDRMAALVTRLVPAAPPGGPPVLVEATPGGWWYSALIPSGVLVVLFVTEATAALDQVATAWHEALAGAPHTRTRLDGARSIGPPEVRPVTVHRAVFPAATCVPVGDAALGLDPLSAAGLRTGLESAHEAAVAVTAALDGDRPATSAYARWVGRMFDGHLAERMRYYDLETRWPAAPFWAARRSPDRTGLRAWGPGS